MTQSAGAWYSSANKYLSFLRSVPIPHANDGETPLEAAPIPYLASTTNAFGLNRLSSGRKDNTDEGKDGKGIAAGEMRQKIDERIEIKPMISQPYKWIWF